MATLMQWEHLLSTRRFKTVEGRIEPGRMPANGPDAGLRSDFHVDHDRVVFSSAFRRLGRKTQVHPLAQNDNTHNRLTHSVEVGCVGRSLGNRIGAMLEMNQRLPAGYSAYDVGAIVQVACLAHDIGNPPFGHTGEDALRVWFRHPDHAPYLNSLSEAERLDVQTFEGNAQSLRMVASLEMHAGQGGMRLTSATIGALTKYPWTSDVFPERGKFNVYRSELDYFTAVATELGLPRLGPQRWARHPLVYLMEAADDICYAILDLEDAVEIDIIDIREFEALLTPLAEIDRVWSTDDPRQKCAMLRGMAVGKCVSEVADRFMAHHDALLNGEFPAKDLLAVCTGRVSDALSAAKELASRKVYRHQSKLVTEIAAYPCLATLLDILVPSAHARILHPDRPLSTRDATHLALLTPGLETTDSLYQAYMKILDFIGGMTDNHAARLARQLSGVGLL